MFLETICILDGAIQNRHGHEKRMVETAKFFGFNPPLLPDLENMLPHNLKNTKVKCRITYDKNIREITFSEYIPKKICALKIVTSPLDYSFKMADRKRLDALLGYKEDCDEILITNNGFIKDTSYSNVVFSLDGAFYTPNKPLLKGTKRQKMLDEGKIIEKEIHCDSITTYDRIYLINAMLDIEDEISIPASKIKR